MSYPSFLGISLTPGYLFIGVFLHKKNLRELVFVLMRISIFFLLCFYHCATLVYVSHCFIFVGGGGSSVEKKNSKRHQVRVRNIGLNIPISLFLNSISGEFYPSYTII
jgi:hypothetical protein